MVLIKHYCEKCESKFTIKYSERACEDSPSFCPFCGEYLLLEDVINKIPMDKENPLEEYEE